MKVKYERIVKLNQTIEKLTIKYSSTEQPEIERLYPNLSNLITLSKEYARKQ